MTTPSSRPRGRSTPAAVAMLVAIAVLHVLNGGTDVSWSPHIPAVQRLLGLTDGSLGLILASLPLGLIVGGILAGRRIDRKSARFVLLEGATGFWGGLALAGAAPYLPEPARVPVLALGLLLFGVGNGLFDVAWGVYSTELEQKLAWRSHVLVQSFFSGGSIVGALAGKLAVENQIPIGVHLGAYAAIALATAVAVTLFVLPDRARKAEEDEDDATAPSALRSPVLWAFTLNEVAFGLGLGAVYVWSAVHLERLGAVGGAVANGIVAFAIAQTIGQLGLGAMPKRWVPGWVLSAVSGLVALAGAWLIVGPGQVGAAIAGFALFGIGLAPIGPLAQSAAGEAFPRRKGQALSTAIVGTYAGALGAPSVIGPLAGATSLRSALGVLAVFCAITVVVSVTAMRRAAGWTNPASTPRD